MNIKVRFFAQFRELLGNEIPVTPQEGMTLSRVIQEVAGKNREGYDAIFNAGGSFHEFVILMKNGKRIGIADAERMTISDGDEIAVFPPIAGG